MPNIDEEIKFYTQGLGMKVTGQREVNGARNVFLAYGEESLRAKDGGVTKPTKPSTRTKQNKRRSYLRKPRPPSPVPIPKTKTQSIFSVSSFALLFTSHCFVTPTPKI